MSPRVQDPSLAALEAVARRQLGERLSLDGWRTQALLER